MKSNNFNSIEYQDLPYSDILTKDQKVRLLNSSKNFKFHKKDTVFRQDSEISHLTYLKSGLIKIFHEGRNNRQIIVKICTPGTLIGLTSVFGDALHHFSAAAITYSETIDMDLSVVKDIISENGRYSLQLLNDLSNESLFTFRRLSSHVYKQLPGKLSDIILYFSEEVFGSAVFSMPLTRKELAHLAGTTKESLIRTLSEFKNDRIIEVEGSLIKIVSMDILKTLSALG